MKKKKLPDYKHINPNTGYVCYYNPECPICEDR